MTTHASSPMTESDLQTYEVAKEIWDDNTPEGRASYVTEMMGWPVDSPRMIRLTNMSFDDLPRENVDDWKQIFAIVLLAHILKEEFSILNHKDAIRVGLCMTTFSMDRIAEDESDLFRDALTVRHPDESMRLDGTVEPATVNWSACGAQEPEIARRMAQLLTAGADYASRLPNPRARNIP